MGLDIAALRTALRKATGTDNSDMPDPDTDLYLNRAYWELLDKYHFREKEVTVTFATIAGTRLYAVPSPFEALRQLSILDPATSQHNKLDQMTPEEYEKVYNEATTSQKLPERYVREACNVRLWPTPDAVYTVTMKYWTVLADLNGVSNTAPPIPQSWHEIILFGGVWRAFVELGDFPRANSVKAHQKALIDSSVPVQAKEEYDTHNAALAPRVREYDV